ncbi:MAG: CCA tRNA nucleotidyltransferase [Massiliimalia sp.]|jgi:tRNA nucleotidyltransferase (CCA-adding enzyme)
MSIKIPVSETAAAVLRHLQSQGYEAWIVGGCVRDSLLGKTPVDWDITTSALPQQIKACFSGCKQVDTGMKHGTVSVQWEGQWFEITTYRIDQNYEDHRRPEKVVFTSNLKEDLARRDFTVNAMAYHPDWGLVDPFGGTEDLRDRRIRCVGEPAKRFQEDALRIMRGLRFASVLGFEIHEDTSREILNHRQLLGLIAPERFSAELKQLLCGKEVRWVLTHYGDVLAVWIPELLPCMGMDQKSPHHHLDLWNHIIQSVSLISPDPILRLAMLLHDIAKPVCQTEQSGICTYSNHAGQSAQMAQHILKRLKFDRSTIQTVCLLISMHSTDLDGSGYQVKSLLGQLGKENLFRLFQVKTADALSQSPSIQAKRIFAVQQAQKQAEWILEHHICCTLSQLAVTGKDLLNAGIPAGKQTGIILSRLLDLVMREQCPNQKPHLLEEGVKIARELDKTASER